MNKIYVLCCSTISLGDREKVKKVLQYKFPNSLIYVPKLKNTSYFTVENANLVYIAGYSENQIEKTAGIKTLRQPIAELCRKEKLGYIDPLKQIVGQLVYEGNVYKTKTSKSYKDFLHLTTPSPKKEELVTPNPRSMDSEQVHKLMSDIGKKHDAAYGALLKELGDLRKEYKSLEDELTRIKLKQAIHKPLYGSSSNGVTITESRRGTTFEEIRKQAEMQSKQPSLRQEDPRLTPRIDRVKFKLDLKSQTCFIVTYKETTITNDLKLLLF